MPTTPGDEPPQPPHGVPPPEEEPVSDPPENQIPTDGDAGWLVVGSGNRQRKVQVSHNLVKAPTPDALARTTAPAYEGTAPPPPPELYHGRGATVEHVVDGKPVYYYKIKYYKDL